MTKCMVKEDFTGLTDEAIKAVTFMIKKRDLEYLPGQMVNDMKEHGEMEDNMALELNLTQKTNLIME